MVLEVLRRLLGGFGVGGLLTFIILSVYVAGDAEVQIPAMTIWSSLLGSMLIGGYFSVASLIFEQDHWSPLKQLVIHFGLSVSLYSLVAITIGWLPPRPLPILGGLVVFVTIYSLFWLGFRYYFKKQAEALNKSVKK